MFLIGTDETRGVWCGWGYGETADLDGLISGNGRWQLVVMVVALVVVLVVVRLLVWLWLLGKRRRVSLVVGSEMLVGRFRHDEAVRC